jgi:hypothetical protein
MDFCMLTFFQHKAMRTSVCILIIVSFLFGCGAKDKAHNGNDEVEILKERIQQHYEDGNYGLAQLEIEKLLAITSSGSQKKLDEKAQKELMELLEKIRQKSREEEREDEDDKDREIPPGE